MITVQSGTGTEVGRVQAEQICLSFQSAVHGDQLGFTGKLPLFLGATILPS